MAFPFLRSANDLLLNDEALSKQPTHRKALLTIEWLDRLVRLLPHSSRTDIKSIQPALTEQLLKILLVPLPSSVASSSVSSGPLIRELAARALAAMYSVGDTLKLFDTINTLNDLVRSKGNAPSEINARLSAFKALGEIYMQLGRMCGRTFEDTVQITLKLLHSVDPQSRAAMYDTLALIITGMGSAAVFAYRDINKAAKRDVSNDRNVHVRIAACKCMLSLVSETDFVCGSHELDSNLSAACRAFDASGGGGAGVQSLEMRQLLALLIARLLERAQQVNNPGIKFGRMSQSQHSSTPSSSAHHQNSASMSASAMTLSTGLNRRTLPEVLNVLATLFLRGGLSSLKSGANTPLESSQTLTMEQNSNINMPRSANISSTTSSSNYVGATAFSSFPVALRASASVSRDIRSGIGLAYVELFNCMGRDWVERHLNIIVVHLLELAAAPSGNLKTGDAAFMQKCISQIWHVGLIANLTERAKLSACRELLQVVRRVWNLAPPANNKSKSSTEISCPVTARTEQLLVCALEQLTILICAVGSLCSSIDVQPTNVSASGGAASTTTITPSTVSFIGDTLLPSLVYPSLHVQVQAAAACKAYVKMCPTRLTPMFTKSLALLEGLDEDLSVNASSISSSSTMNTPESVSTPVGLASQQPPFLVDARIGLAIALAGMMSASRASPTGMPARITSRFYWRAEELLRLALKHPRSALVRIQCAWYMIASYVTASGPNMLMTNTATGGSMRGVLAKFLELCQKSFPLTQADADKELDDGDAFTWTLTLENRAGALLALRGLILSADGDLSAFSGGGGDDSMSDDSEKRATKKLPSVLDIVQSAVMSISTLTPLSKSFGPELRNTLQVVRLRLLQVLASLPIKAILSFYGNLMPEFLADITGVMTSDPPPPISSLLGPLCGQVETAALLALWPSSRYFLLHGSGGGSSSNHGSGGARDDLLLQLLVLRSIDNDPSALFMPPAVLSNLGLFADSGGSGPTAGSTTNRIGDGSAENSNRLSDWTSVFYQKEIFGNSGTKSDITCTSSDDVIPLPQRVATLDLVCTLFGRLFVCIPMKQRTQLLSTLYAAIRQMKPPARQDLLCLNVAVALIVALRTAAELKCDFSDDDHHNTYAAGDGNNSVTSICLNIVNMYLLKSPLDILRFAGAELLGRLVQQSLQQHSGSIGSDGRPQSLLARTVQISFDELRRPTTSTGSTDHLAARTAYSIVLGALHRYAGGMASSSAANMNKTVSSLDAQTRDAQAPQVQTWSLIAMADVAESGGSQFRPFVEPLCASLLNIITTSGNKTVIAAAVQCIAAIVMGMGPELADTSSSDVQTIQRTILAALTVLQQVTMSRGNNKNSGTGDSEIKANVLLCYQRLQLFAPRCVEVGTLLPYLVNECLVSNARGNSCATGCYRLQRSAMALLRQLCQRDADLVCSLSLTSGGPPPSALALHSHLSNMSMDTDAATAAGRCRC